MLLTPFLTELDSRAAIKGSRDPLGVQTIWSRLGRQVVGNLTTVSNSVTDFTVLLLGYYFVERVADEGGMEGDLATFLKWEQLAAYARAHVNREGGFRGTERVKQRLQDGGRIRLGIDSEAQILSNQKIYGLWGLYTVPAKASGLLEADPVQLNRAGRELIEEVYLPMLAEAGLRDGRAIVERLRGPSYTLDLGARSKDAPVLAAVAKLLDKLPARARTLYRDHLLYGGPNDEKHGTRGRQRVFADVLGSTFEIADWQLSPSSVEALARLARKHGEKGEELAHHLDRIRAAELLLAPAVAFFEYALRCDGQSPREIADHVQQHWGTAPRRTINLEATEALVPVLNSPNEDPDAGPRWLQLARALSAAKYEDALTIVLQQNTAVMKARAAAAPWAVVKQDKLHVQFRDEHLSHLPEKAGLAAYWLHAYFIDSLRRVARRLRG